LFFFGLIKLYFLAFSDVFLVFNKIVSTTN